MGNQVRVNIISLPGIKLDDFCTFLNFLEAKKLVTSTIYNLVSIVQERPIFKF